MDFAAIRIAVIYLLEIMQYAILIRVLISWLPVPRENPFIVFLYNITEPMLGPIRRLFENSSMGKGLPIDFSPIVAFMIIKFIQYYVESL